MSFAGLRNLLRKLKQAKKFPIPKKVNLPSRLHRFENPHTSGTPFAGLLNRQRAHIRGTTLVSHSAALRRHHSTPKSLDPVTEIRRGRLLSLFRTSVSAEYTVLFGVPVPKLPSMIPLPKRPSSIWLLSLAAVVMYSSLSSPFCSY